MLILTQVTTTVYATLDYGYRYENKGTGLVLVPRKCGMHEAKLGHLLSFICIEEKIKSTHTRHIRNCMHGGKLFEDTLLSVVVHKSVIYTPQSIYPLEYV